MLSSSTRKCLYGHYTIKAMGLPSPNERAARMEKAVPSLLERNGFSPLFSAYVLGGRAAEHIH